MTFSHLWLSLCICYAYAWQFPLATNWYNPVERVHDEPRRLSVACIGAGPGGSFATFALAFVSKHYEASIDVTLFDSEDYIGGRSNTIPLPKLHKSEGDSVIVDEEEPYVELGASIFVGA